MPGPHADDLGDVLVGDDRRLLRLVLVPLRAELLDRLLALGLLVPQPSRGLVVLAGDRLVLLAGDLLQGELRLLDRRGSRGGSQSHPRAGLVDQVDRLVGQGAVGDVTHREVDRGVDRLVADLHVMVLLVPLADAEEDVDRLVDGRLLDHDRLEAALEGGVLLDVLAVLVEGGGADALQLAAAQRWLEDVGRVDRPLGGARPDERVELVDEEDVVVRAAQLLDDLLEPLLELAAVLRAGDERADVEGQDALVGQRLGHVAGDDALREGLGDRGLADAGLADQRGIVLRLAPEDLDDPLDLLLAADDGVEGSGAGGIGQVDAELVERGGLRRTLRLLGRGRARALAEDVDDLVAHLVEVDAEALEHAGGDALALTDESEQQVLGADVVVAEAACLVDGQLDDALRARSEPDVTDDRSVAATDDELDGGANLGQLDVHVLEHARGDALALADEPEQQVLGADVVVVEALRLVLGEGQHLPRSIGELVESVHG